jgi:large conductance mechanosensitive channel
MGLFKDFRDFAMRGNVIDLAVGVIIGAAFGGVTKSMVDDLLMPPIGKLVGNLDFSNLYFSMSDKVDAANRTLAERIAATQPATAESVIGAVTSVFDTAARLPLAEALVINFIIVAFCVFIVVKLMMMARKRFEKEQAIAPAPVPPDVVLLTEIRDILKSK